MSAFIKCFFIITILEFLDINIGYVWTHDCNEERENDLSQPPINHPRQQVYNQDNHLYEYADEWEEYVIKSIKTICNSVSFPFKYIMTECDECTQILKIQSISSPKIPSAALGYISKINILDLSNLHITTISPGAFGQNPLTEINLSENNLTVIGLGVFNSFVNMKNLDLSHNNIKVLLPNCFTGITNLKMLNISVNQLTEFSFNVLDPNVVQIDYFNISFNKLSKFDLDDKINILHMWLNNNEIKHTQFCYLMFFSLYLNNNLLETLPEGNCNDSVNKLAILDVSFNKISEIKQFYFQNASKLEYLFLNHNNISNISIGAFFDLHNLKTLNLSQNNLQHFQYGTFDGLHNLEVLDLSYNKIKSTNMMLHALNNLKQLYLHNNNINSIDISKNSYLNLNLSKLSLHNNNFTCDNLIKLFQNSNFHSVLIYGPTRNTSNIHGIACLENSHTKSLPNKDFENIKSNIENVVTSLLRETNDKNQKEKDVIKDYFNNDFKNSNFYKFMSNFEEPNFIKFNETEIFKYFNTDFENSKFYKYLESLKDTKNFTEFKKNVYEYFNDDFKNSGFVKYLEDIKNYKSNLDEDFSKSGMYNYFNKDFMSSQFYKYLEGLKIPTYNLPDTEKLVRTEKIEDKSNVIGVIINNVFMIIICILLGILIYKTFYSKITKPREQVELLQT